MFSAGPASVVDLLEHKALPELANAVRSRIEKIMARWDESVRGVLPTADYLTFGQLRDDSLVILRQLADALASADPVATVALGESSRERASIQFDEQYDLWELLVEYRLLRRIVIEEVETALPRSLSIVERITLHMGIDAMLQRAVLAFVERQKEMLRDSEERFRTMVDTIPQLAWTARADGFIQWYNRRCYEYTGTTLQDLEGWGWQSVLDPQVLPKALEQWKDSIATGQPFDMVFPLRGADGRFRPFLTRILPLKDAQGRVVQWFGTNTDVEELTRAEAAKLSAEQAKGVAENASQAKNHFLAVLSHELRTPLAPVAAAVAMLEEDPRFDADTRESLEMIRRNVELEARLIDDLLDITRIERGKVELDKRPIELCTIMRHAAEVCMPDIEARQLEFGIKIIDGPYLVEADAARLQQVFWNLLKNAIKFTPHGGCVGMRVRRDGDGQVIAEVHDSGIGFTPEATTRIFNAFEQAERSITRQFGGLGLGLAISKAIVELHGGTLTAHSEGQGKGATFAVRLPILTANAAGSTAPTTPQTPAPATRPVRILLVEDHGDTARIVRRVLSAAGHQVQIAGDVATALQLAAEQPFDLLLSDLGLPDGSGLDLMRALRAKGMTLPGIALSGYGQDQDMEQSRQAGFLTHLLKPVSLAKLKEAIAKAVGCGTGIKNG